MGLIEETREALIAGISKQLRRMKSPDVYMTWPLHFYVRYAGEGADPVAVETVLGALVQEGRLERADEYRCHRHFDAVVEDVEERDGRYTGVCEDCGDLVEVQRYAAWKPVLATWAEFGIEANRIPGLTPEKLVAHLEALPDDECKAFVDEVFVRLSA